MHIYIPKYTDICIYIHTYINVYAHVHIHIHRYVHMYMCTRLMFVSHLFWHYDHAVYVNTCTYIYK